MATCFGQAARFFVLLDAAGEAETQSIANPGFGVECSGEDCGSESCPGIMAARALKNTGVVVVLTKNIGKHAFRELGGTILIYQLLESVKTVREALERFRSGSREFLDGPTIQFGRQEEKGK